MVALASWPGGGLAAAAGAAFEGTGECCWGAGEFAITELIYLLVWEICHKEIS